MRNSKGHIEIWEHRCSGQELPRVYSDENFRQVREFHKSLSGYKATPLVRLLGMAKELGLKDVFLKDESKRFGLDSFKALGASYGLDYAIKENPDREVVVTATDGNHGKAVAWAAKNHGKKSVVFMPKDSAPTRAKAIADIHGAQVLITDVNYAAAVRMAAAYAEENNAILVQDTAFDGYEEIPQKVVLGYSTMAAEAAEQMGNLGSEPTHVFLQAGVGSMAAGSLAYLAARYGKKSLPTFLIMEAYETACIFESVVQGEHVTIDGLSWTKMAGLNCGEPNPAVLPLLASYAGYYAKCSDEVAFEGMRRLAGRGFVQNGGSDPKVVAGECGAIGAGLLTRLMTDPEMEPWRKKIGLNREATVLLFNTEGDTDPDNYHRVVGYNSGS